MAIGKIFKQYIKKPEKRVEVLFTSSKHVFLMTAFLFFLAYFCIAAGFYDEYFIVMFLPLYISFILSFVIFLDMLTLYHGKQKIPKILMWILCVVWLGLGAFFLIPVL